MAEVQNRKCTVAICAALALLTLLAFLPVKDCDFVNFDDPEYVTDNDVVKEGLTWHGAAWAFTTGHAANWHPLTWLSHMADCELYGSKPTGHHITNLFFHVVNVLLLFLLFRKISDAVWQSAIVAALFAIHPLHVESVAWVAERKDVLSTFFFLLTIWFYVRFAQARGNSRPAIANYILALVFFALGLMSKPMLVTLPFVLLLLDYWPLQRFMFHDSRFTIGSLVREKIPFFLLAAGSCAITFAVQQQGGSVRTLAKFPFWSRLETVFVGYAGYIRNMFWPKNLGAYYTHPSDWPIWDVAVAVTIVLGMSGMVFALRRNRPWLVVGWLWFLGILVPVIGIVQVGGQYMADRYTYIPLIGLFVMLVWGGANVVSKLRLGKFFAAAVIGVVLASCFFQTRTQVGYWQSSAKLFTHALEVTTNTVSLDTHAGATLTILAHNNLALALANEGKFDEAIAHYSEALRIRPDLSRAHYGLGIALAGQGKWDEAITHYSAVVKVMPNYADIHANLAAALGNAGKINEAIAEYLQSLKLNPNDPAVQASLALALESQGKTPEAVEHYNRAIELKPDDAASLNNLAWIFAASTNADWRSPDEAVRSAERACELTENKTPLFIGTLAAAYAAAGKFSEAAAAAERARSTAMNLGQTNVAARNDELLKLYRRGRAVYEAGATNDSPSH